jgi:nitronate monooxygenase
VAAVSNAGALGSFAAGYTPPGDITAAVAAIRQRTERPFAVNLFAPLENEAPKDAEAMLAVVGRLHAELGLEPPSLSAPPRIPLDDQIAAVMEAGVPIVSFTFGLLPDATVARLKERGTYLIGTATTVDEAIVLERQGIDAVVAQGSEAGGHRGSFRTSAPGGLIGTIALVPQVAGTVRVPVIASGGIMDGRGLAAARILGASAAQLGTAFLTCTESGLPAPVKDALLRATENDTVMTNAMTGRYGRALRNRLTDALQSAGVPPLGFAWQTALLTGIRRAAVEQGRVDLLPLFAGQGLRLLRALPAAELVSELAREAREAIAAAAL